jgi:hypothetical protein
MKNDLTIFYAPPSRKEGQTNRERFDEIKKHYDFLVTKQDETRKESERLVDEVYKNRNSI